MLNIIGVSNSGYYDWKKRKPSNQQKRKQAIKEEITKIHNESHQIYGAPKITSILVASGETISEKTVGNYMREEGIKAIWVRSYKRQPLIQILIIDLKTS